MWNGYLFSNRSQCWGVQRIGGNFHNRYGSYLGWTRLLWWTRPSLVKDGRDHLGRLALLKWWVKFHEVLSVHRRTRLARMLGTFTSPIWFIVACLSLDETYGRVMELDDFCDTINNQLESFFLFLFSAKRNTFGFPNQTPKAIICFTEPTTSDLNIKTIICHHSIKKSKSFSFVIVNSYELRLDGMTKLELGRCY